MARFAKREYTLELVTPAFLGGYDQSAEWRTAGIKALIRQWWRVVYVAEHGVNVAEMRQIEADLFGSVNESTGGARQARLRLRFGEWKKGSLTTMPRSGQTVHPEVRGGMNIGTFLYLGYGPLGFDQALERNQAKLNKGRALDPSQKNTLKLIGQNLTDAEWLSIDKTMQLIHLFGTIGGRSRNGWGSIQLYDSKTNQPLAALDALPIASIALDKCLAHDWPTAIASHQNRVLIWQGKSVGYASWGEAMDQLAKIKIAIRTQFTFDSGTHPQPEDRHYLSYPVTNHKVSAWEPKRKDEKQKRLPNSLRFKVIKDSTGKYVPIAVHLPHKLPADFHANISTEKLSQIWQQVYQKLDAEMKRI